MEQKPLQSAQFATQRAGFRIYLLGPPTTTWNDTAWVVTRRTVRALLYRLASEPGAITRGHLQLLLWPDVPELLARRNLSHHLTHLRRSMPGLQVLGTDQARVWLEPGSFWCDVLQFKKASLEPPADISSLLQLANFYRGSFLQGFDLPHSEGFEHWCTVERVSLENHYLKILGTLVDHYTSRGETSQAILSAQRYLETDPLSELMHQRLIQLYAAAGDRHLALQQFERCSEMLESELGVDPLPETWGVYQAVLKSQRRFPQPQESQQTFKLPDFKTPILDRERELQSLEEAFRQLQSNHSRFILISGEAGIGKSYLVQEFATSKLGKANILFGAANPGEQSIPYQPILDIIRPIVGLKEPRMKETGERISSLPIPTGLVDPIWLSEISRLLPEMHSVITGLPLPPPLEPEFARSRLFEGLSRLLLAFASVQGPILLILDDLQWTDPLTQAWLVHLGHLIKKGDHPILILGTYRSEEAEAILELRHSLARQGVLEEIYLPGLREGAVLQLLQSIVGQRTGAGLLAHRIHQATGGNPFYLIEILRQLVDEGTLGEQFSGSTQFRLPESIREAIQARLDRLSPIARQVLEAGAVIGPAFGIDLLRLAAGRSHVEILGALEELAARILLVEDQGVYRFIHELTRQHVAANLGHVRRQLLHRRAGRALSRLQPDSYSMLALHFELGGDPQRALGYYELANQGAQTIFAWQVAEAHQGRMLALLGRIDPRCAQREFIRKRADILAERAHSRYLLGNLAGRDIDLAAIYDLGEASQDDSVRLQAIFHRLRYLNLDGEYQQAIEVAEKGLALLRTSPEYPTEGDRHSEAQARLLAQLGFAYYFLGKPLEALGVLEDAVEICGISAKPEACGRIHHILGYVYFHLGDFHRALECQQYASACHKESGDYNRLAWDLIDIGALHKNLGDLTKARRFIDDGLELSRRVGSPPAVAYGLAHSGSLDLYQGNYSAAETHYRQALDLQKEIRSEHLIATAEAGIGLASYHLGNSVQSRHWLERAIQRARSCGHRRRIAETLIQLGLLDIVEVCLDVARRHLEEGLSIAQDCESVEGEAAGLAALARLERYAGDLERALELAIEAVCLAEQSGLTSCEMWGEVEAGLACLALGDVRSAMKHTVRATGLAAEASQDWLGPEEAYRAHAQVLHAAGQVEEAVRLDSCANNFIHENSLHITEPLVRERYLLKLTVPK